MLLMSVLLALAIVVAIGNNWLTTTTVDVESPGLPESFDGYCVAQVSDLHARSFGSGNSRLVRAVRDEAPNLIAITGDLTRLGRWNGERVDGLARQLREVAPTCLVTGNHDYLARDLLQLLSLLEKDGVKVLESAWIDVVRGSDSIVVSGMQDPGAFHRGRVKGRAIPGWMSALEALRARTGSDRFTVLLSHRPEFFDEYARLGFDLVLSGHAHGGQVRLPIVGALYAPDQGWFPPLTSGAHRRGNTTLVVSRGLGNSRFPMRIFNRPELVVVRLKRPRT